MRRASVSDTGRVSPLERRCATTSAVCAGAHTGKDLHGYVMNGGLDHGLDVMGAEVERAAAGWEHLGRRDVADLLREALAAVPDMPADREERADFFTDGWTDAQAEAIERLDARYEDDEALEQAFLRHLRRNPDDFAPVPA